MLQKITNSDIALNHRDLSRDTLQDDLTFPLLTDKQIALLNPATLVPRNLGFGGTLSRSLVPDVNEETGDIRWSAEEGVRFTQVTAVIEKLGTRMEATKIDKWSLDEMESACVSAVDALLIENCPPGLKELLKPMMKTGLSERAWQSLTADDRTALLQGKLKSLMSATSSYEMYCKHESSTLDALRAQLETPTKLVSQGNRVGLEVTQEIPGKNAGETTQEKFYIFLESTDDTEGNQKGGFRIGDQEKWSVVVRCSSGHETPYVFGETDFRTTPLVRKPVIYLYPTTTSQVSVDLEYDGEVVAEYPQRVGKGWQVEAQPDGKLKIAGSNIQYPYLFWEGKPTNSFSAEFAEGYCVAKTELVAFLESQLAQRGLKDAEVTDFITYWYPIMSRNRFSLVRFATDEYTSSARLSIEPKPDTLIRLFMVFKGVGQSIDLVEPQVTTIQRTGFTAVEWGGINLDE